MLHSSFFAPYKRFFRAGREKTVNVKFTLFKLKTNRPHHVRMTVAVLGFGHVQASPRSDFGHLPEQVINNKRTAYFNDIRYPY